ncbi:MAG: GNAT family N-acetyltransferase [Oligoflexia bacterium]|nr:GNAT family N-acetyltransferase [Oligoflexia bacterium]
MSLGLYYKNELVGDISMSLEKFPKLWGLVGNIGILPKYRGKGLSNNLYYEGLSWLRSQKIKQFVGISSTDRVLSKAKKMKRKVIMTSLKI